MDRLRLLAVSSRGRRLASTVLYRIDADGSNPTLLGNPDVFDYEPKVSPDGTEVLFQRWFGDGNASPLVVTDLATGGNEP